MSRIYQVYGTRAHEMPLRLPEAADAMAPAAPPRQNEGAQRC